ncbi:hypothetical protein GCM10009864_06310 [Streptomyces lunalinharesii]|uniref:Uncharacterized protein n=1 Tax=Streptomyces lunalinharesii TaxID=333384 RepID=A0ABP6DLA8_9ACTN
MQGGEGHREEGRLRKVDHEGVALTNCLAAAHDKAAFRTHEAGSQDARSSVRLAAPRQLVATDRNRRNSLRDSEHSGGGMIMWPECA